MVTNRGWVNPANSITFDDATLCNFYKWGAQMFLWLTTPLGNAYVFDGPDFFDVVHDGSGFAFQPNTADDRNNKFTLRDLKDLDPTDSTGQAGGGGVLLSQKKSLVYYGINVNDVFAYYLTGQKRNAFAGTSIAENFPTTGEDLQLVETFAERYFLDGMALAMEIKTSWVDVETVDASRYVVIDARVPDYNTSDPQKWNYTSDKPARLAMVGMHVVGTVNGHPELVWSSFEHVDNAPDKAYVYTNTENMKVTIKFDSSGNWVFMRTGGADTNVIPEYQKIVKGNIQSTGANPIQPVNVVRLDPWGGLPSDVKGGGTPKLVANATDLVSLNSSVMQALARVDDVRGNYFQLGGIWSQKGQIPTSGSEPYLRGSLNLSNATMETYYQYSPAPGGSTGAPSCFGCHSTNTGRGIDLSHIFAGLKPLP